MCSVHYKFRSLISYKTINFNGLQISVEEVKQRIFDAEKLNPEIFDLLVENSLFTREYTGKDLIPRNSALVIKRIPRQDSIRLPKIQ
jgi:E3 ubiquitin-protein ligase RBBP6